MTFHVRNQPDFFTGLMFVMAGAGFSYGATKYEIGTAAQMGPGFFPLLLGGLLALLGLVVVLWSLSPKNPVEAVERIGLKPLLLVLGAVTLFGVLLVPLGLILASVVLLFMSTLASHEFQWRYALVTMLILISACYLIFILGLGLPIPILPRGM